MALRNLANTTAPVTTTTPAAGRFEVEETTTTVAQVTPPANDSAAAAPAPAATAPNDPAPTQPAPQAAAVPAVQAATAVAVSEKSKASAFSAEVEAMRGAGNFAYAVHPQFKGNNGEIMQSGGDKLGRWVKVTMAAWDDHWEVSPGSKSDKSKDAVAYSKDGVTVKSVIGNDAYGEWVGKSVDDYVNYLQNDGDYPQARASRYIDVICYVHEADNEDKFNGEIIMVTLAKSSIPSFESYQANLLMKARMVERGISVKLPEDPFTFFFLRDVVTKGDNTWTKLRIVTALPTKF